MRAVFLIQAVLIAATAQAEPITGGVFLGSRMKSLPCSKILRFYKAKGGQVYHQTLWRSSFGRQNRCLTKITQLPRKVTLQLNLSNEAGRRNGTLEPGDLLPGLNVDQYNRLLEGESGDVNQLRTVRYALAAAYAFCAGNSRPGLRCLLGLGLESNYTERAAKNLAILAQFEGWDRSELVYNPCFGYRGTDVARYFEHHRLYVDPRIPAARRINTADGLDIDFCSGRYTGRQNRVAGSDLREWFNRHRGEIGIFGAWCAGWQGARDGDRKHPRRERAATTSRNEFDQFLDIWRQQ